MSGPHRLGARALGVALALVCLLAAPVGVVLAQDADAKVTMQNISFAPTTTYVAPGQTVMWVNGSAVQHTVTADDASFDSDLIDPGGVFLMSFDAPRTSQH